MEERKDEMLKEVREVEEEEQQLKQPTPKQLDGPFEVMEVKVEEVTGAAR